MLTVCYHIIFHAIFLMAAIRNWGVMTNVGLTTLPVGWVVSSEQILLLFWWRYSISSFSAFSAGSARDKALKSFPHAQSRVRRVHRGWMFLPWFRERLIMANPQTLRVKIFTSAPQGAWSVDRIHQSQNSGHKSISSFSALSAREKKHLGIGDGE